MRRTTSRRVAIYALVAFSAAGCRLLQEGGAGDDPARVAAAAQNFWDESVPVDGAGLAAGKYVGYARLAEARVRVATTLDLVEMSRTGSGATYRAVLRMMPGGFDSFEYAALYWQDVRWDAGARTLTFGGGRGDTPLTVQRLAAGVIRGELKSAADGGLAELALFKTEGERGGAKGLWPAPAAEAFAPLPVAKHVTGHYAGQCADGAVAVQLEASRWRGGRATDEGLFGGHRIAARIAHSDDVTCGTSAICVREAAANVSYNMFTGAMRLKTGRRDLDCTLSQDQLACADGCKFTKGSAPHAVIDTQKAGGPAVFARKQHVATVREAEVEGVEDESDGDGERGAPDQPGKARRGKSGQYYGWIHFEGRDVYQLVALNVKATKAPAEAGDAEGAKPRVVTKIAAVASTYYGEGDSDEFVAYKFQEAVWPPARGSGAFVFDGDGEVFFVVRSWDQRTLRGEWHSKTYGRVGTVEMQRDLVPAMPSDAQIIGRIGGVYTGDGWDFELAVAADLSEDSATFFPLKAFGWAKEKLPNGRRRTISGAAVDPYTGGVALNLDDSRTVIGRLTGSGMALYWPPVPRLGSPVVTGTTLVFKRMGDASLSQTRITRGTDTARLIR